MRHDKIKSFSWLNSSLCHCHALSFDLCSGVPNLRTAYRQASGKQHPPHIRSDREKETELWGKPMPTQGLSGLSLFISRTLKPKMECLCLWAWNLRIPSEKGVVVCVREDRLDGAVVCRIQFCSRRAQTWPITPSMLAGMKERFLSKISFVDLCSCFCLLIGHYASVSYILC